MPGLFERLFRLFGAPPARQEPAAGETRPQPLARRVLAVAHDPVLHSRGEERLRAHMRWNDPQLLARSYIEEVRRCSYGCANYAIAGWITVDTFPVKADGFEYDERSYLEACRQERSFHQPDTLDYGRLVEEFGILARIEAGDIDEVWLFGFPYAGYYESVMGGPGAFWCNGPPLLGSEGSGRRFVVMGFSYERGVGEMLEDLGHRAEAILSHVFARRRSGPDLFERFTRYDRAHPGRAECGNVHFAPNSQADYDWGNPRPVLSRCDNWYRFPELGGEPRLVDCRDWGNGDIREHHRWWLRHLPHRVGESDGISWNWWEYILDPGRA